jgi:hypothetical protein
VGAEIYFVVPLQEAALFIGRNHFVFLSMESTAHRHLAITAAASRRAGRSKIPVPYFSSAVSEDWEMAQDASKYIRLSLRPVLGRKLPIICTITTRVPAHT